MQISGEILRKPMSYPHVHIYLPAQALFIPQATHHLIHTEAAHHTAYIAVATFRIWQLSGTQQASTLKGKNEITKPFWAIIFICDVNKYFINYY